MFWFIVKLVLRLRRVPDYDVEPSFLIAPLWLLPYPVLLISLIEAYDDQSKVSIKGGARVYPLVLVGANARPPYTREKVTHRFVLETADHVTARYKDA